MIDKDIRIPNRKVKYGDKVLEVPPKVDKLLLWDGEDKLQVISVNGERAEFSHNIAAIVLRAIDEEPESSEPQTVVFWLGSYYRTKRPSCQVAAGAAVIVVRRSDTVADVYRVGLSEHIVSTCEHPNGGILVIEETMETRFLSGIRYLIYTPKTD